MKIVVDHRKNLESFGKDKWQSDRNGAVPKFLVTFPDFLECDSLRPRKMIARATCNRV